MSDATDVMPTGNGTTKKVPDLSLERLVPRRSRWANAAWLVVALGAIAVAVVSAPLARPEVMSRGSGSWGAIQGSPTVLATDEVELDSRLPAEWIGIADYPGATAVAAWLVPLDQVEYNQMLDDETASERLESALHGQPEMSPEERAVAVAVAANPTLGLSDEYRLPHKLKPQEPHLLAVLWHVTDCDRLAKASEFSQGQAVEVVVRSAIGTTRHSAVSDPGEILSPGFNMATLVDHGICPR